MLKNSVVPVGVKIKGGEIMNPKADYNSDLILDPANKTVIIIRVFCRGKCVSVFRVPDTGASRRREIAEMLVPSFIKAHKYFVNLGIKV
jgi:hypothetical protein